MVTYWSCLPTLDWAFKMVPALPRGSVFADVFKKNHSSEK